MMELILQFGCLAVCLSLGSEAVTMSDLCENRHFGYKVQDPEDCHAYFACLGPLGQFNLDCGRHYRFSEAEQMCIIGKCPPYPYVNANTIGIPARHVDISNGRKVNSSILIGQAFGNENGSMAADLLLQGLNYNLDSADATKPSPVVIQKDEILSKTQADDWNNLTTTLDATGRNEKSSTISLNSNINDTQFFTESFTSQPEDFAVAATSSYTGEGHRNSIEPTISQSDASTENNSTSSSSARDDFGHKVEPTISSLSKNSKIISVTVLSDVPTNSKKKTNLNDSSTPPASNVSFNSILLQPKVATTDDSSTLCKDRSDGDFMRDPSDCTKFYTCYQNIAYFQQCPGGLYFDQVSKMCKSPNLVDCPLDIIAGSTSGLPVETKKTTPSMNETPSDISVDTTTTLPTSDDQSEMSTSSTIPSTEFLTEPSTAATMQVFTNFQSQAASRQGSKIATSDLSSELTATESETTAFTELPPQLSTIAATTVTSTDGPTQTFTLLPGETTSKTNTIDRTATWTVLLPKTYTDAKIASATDEPMKTSTLPPDEATTQTNTIARTETLTVLPTETSTDTTTGSPTDEPIQTSTLSPDETTTQTNTETSTDATTGSPTDEPIQASTLPPDETTTETNTETSTDATTGSPTDEPTQTSTLPPDETTTETNTETSTDAGAGSATDEPMQTSTLPPDETTTYTNSIASTETVTALPTETSTDATTGSPTDEPIQTSTLPPDETTTETNTETSTDATTGSPTDEPIQTSTLPPDETTTETNTETSTDATTGSPTDEPTQTSTLPPDETTTETNTKTSTDAGAGSATDEPIPTSTLPSDETTTEMPTQTLTEITTTPSCSTKHPPTVRPCADETTTEMPTQTLTEITTTPSCSTKHPPTVRPCAVPPKPNMENNPQSKYYDTWYGNDNGYEYQTSNEDEVPPDSGFYDYGDESYSPSDLEQQLPFDNLNPQPSSRYNYEYEVPDVDPNASNFDLESSDSYDYKIEIPHGTASASQSELFYDYDEPIMPNAEASNVDLGSEYNDYELEGQSSNDSHEPQLLDDINERPNSYSHSSAEKIDSFALKNFQSQSVPGDCQRLPSGTFIRDPSDCNTYYVCRDGSHVQLKCPRGQYFDDEKFVCNFKHLVTNCRL